MHGDVYLCPVVGGGLSVICFFTSIGRLLFSSSVFCLFMVLVRSGTIDSSDSSDSSDSWLDSVLVSYSDSLW